MEYPKPAKYKMALRVLTLNKDFVSIGRDDFLKD